MNNTSSCNGCTKCCELIAIDNVPQENLIRSKLPYWKPVNKHIAEQINKRLVNSYEQKNKNPLYYTCQNLTEFGCGIHDSSPKVCKDYPLYGKTVEEFISLSIFDPPTATEYTEHCNYIEGLISIKDVTNETIKN